MKSRPHKSLKNLIVFSIIHTTLNFMYSLKVNYRIINSIVVYSHQQIPQKCILTGVSLGIGKISRPSHLADIYAASKQYSHLSWHILTIYSCRIVLDI